MNYYLQFQTIMKSEEKSVANTLQRVTIQEDWMVDALGGKRIDNFEKFKKFSVWLFSMNEPEFIHDFGFLVGVGFRIVECLDDDIKIDKYYRLYLHGYDKICEEMNLVFGDW
jgi:hypothetical protein